MNPEESCDPLRQEAIRALRSAAGLSPEPGLPDGSYDVGSELTVQVKGGAVVSWSAAWGRAGQPAAGSVRCEIQAHLLRARRTAERLGKLLAAMPADGEGGAG